MGADNNETMAGELPGFVTAPYNAVVRVGHFDFDRIFGFVVTNGIGLTDAKNELTSVEKVMVFALVSTKLNLLRFGMEEDDANMFCEVLVNDIATMWESAWVERMWEAQ